MEHPDGVSKVVLFGPEVLARYDVHHVAHSEGEHGFHLPGRTVLSSDGVF